MMKVAVVVFPGTNREEDALNCFGRIMGFDTVPVWHESGTLGGADLVVLPGGFSYGDYLRCGAIARFSPVMAAVKQHAKAGGLTLGICNGFQILVEAGLLPGALLRNRSLRFACRWLHLKVQTEQSPFTRATEVGDVLKIPCAHGDGNYFAPPELLKQLNDERRIAFRYCTEHGEVTAESNPNGSVENIAGILSEGRNVLGLMPHPEDAVEELTGSSDGRRIFESLKHAYADIGW
jgi:phosphoribosylformylglycinamidine synthase subunit PurQ / glutaminase